MVEVNVFVKYERCGVVTVLGPSGQYIQLYPGSESRLKLSVYEKEKKKK